MYATHESRLLKVIILGNSGIGKSSIMNRFINNKFGLKGHSTIGVEFLNKDIIVDGILYTLQIWDTAGQERFKSLRTPFYRGSDICLLAFSYDDQDSFNDLELWQKEFLHYGDVPDGLPFPFVLIGSKSDIPSDYRAVSKKDAEQWCERGGFLDQTLIKSLSKPKQVAISSRSSSSSSSNSHGNGGSGGIAAPSFPFNYDRDSFVIPFIEVSAKEGSNIDECFRQAVLSWRRWDASQYSTINQKKDSFPLDGKNENRHLSTRWWFC